MYPMYLCMYVYLTLYVCMYVICMYVCAQLCNYVWMYVCMYTWQCHVDIVCMYVGYVHVHMYVCIRTYVRMHVCMYVCVYVLYILELVLDNVCIGGKKWFSCTWRDLASAAIVLLSIYKMHSVRCCVTLFFFRCIVLLDVSFSLVTRKINGRKDNMGTKSRSHFRYGSC